MKILSWTAEVTPATPTLRLFATVAKKTLYCKIDYVALISISLYYDYYFA